jgi:hypothetical protein
MRGKGSIAFLMGFEKGRRGQRKKDFLSDNLEETWNGGTRDLFFLVKLGMRKGGFASKTEGKEGGFFLVGLSAQGLYRKEYWLKSTFLCW